jgi:sucrose-6F-phosphate phosphohydrolase
VTEADRLLICTDLDRTLIPNGPARESGAAAGHFETLAARPEVTLAYVSGRHRALIESAILDYRLPQPDFVIGDVGTSLYPFGDDGDRTENATWDRRISRDWAGKTSHDLARILADLAPLRPQEAEKQTRHKLSFYLDADADSTPLMSEVERRLRQSGLRARLVYSVDDLSGEGLLDILPASASKWHAIEALMEFERFSLSGTVFCGDSGNDMEVFLSPVCSVVVANARESVKHEAVARAHAAHLSDTLYVARGGFLGMNGNYRGGMLEGIAHYHPRVAGWLLQDRDDADGAVA